MVAATRQVYHNASSGSSHMRLMGPGRLISVPRCSDRCGWCDLGAAQRGYLSNSVFAADLTDLSITPLRPVDRMAQSKMISDLQHVHVCLSWHTFAMPFASPGQLCFASFGSVLCFARSLAGFGLLLFCYLLSLGSLCDAFVCVCFVCFRHVSSCVFARSPRSGIGCQRGAPDLLPPSCLPATFQSHWLLLVSGSLSRGPFCFPPGPRMKSEDWQIINHDIWKHSSIIEIWKRNSIPGGILHSLHSAPRKLEIMVSQSISWVPLFPGATPRIDEYPAHPRGLRELLLH